jgi:hypothetical protein
MRGGWSRIVLAEDIVTILGSAKNGGEIELCPRMAANGHVTMRVSVHSPFKLVF